MCSKRNHIHKAKAKAIKLKKWQKHITCDYKCKFNSTTCNSTEKWNNKTNTTVTERDEIIIVVDNLSTKKTNTITPTKRQYYSNRCYEYCFNKLSL